MSTSKANRKKKAIARLQEESVKADLQKKGHISSMRQKKRASGGNTIDITDPFAKAPRLTREEARSDTVISNLYWIRDNCIPCNCTEDNFFGWKGTIEEWIPRGKSPNTILLSLVDHLVVKYPVPRFLYAALFQDISKTYVNERDYRWIHLFHHLATGGSIKIMTERRQDLIPAKMTKKMAFLFMQTTENLEFIHAVRQAQVRGLGGHPALANAICGTRIMGRGFGDLNREDFLFEVMQWFCNHPMIPAEQVDPLCDFISYRKHENKDFSMKGRSPIRLLEEAERWHTEINRTKKLVSANYKPSGFTSGFFEKKGPGSFSEIYTIDEILTRNELAAEGRAMANCVLSYGIAIEKGITSIWSMKNDGERIATIEVNKQSRTVVQVRARFNKPVNHRHLNLIEQWAKDNNLRVSRWL